MGRRKIVIIGGGSVSWAPMLVKDLVMTNPLHDAEYVLYDIDKKASDFTKKVCDRIIADERMIDLPRKPKIVSTDNLKKAFSGADYFIITITTGGLKAIKPDLMIPEEYGIYHSVGDTCGPAAWARILRNFDTFAGIAEAANRYAPGAMILNYSNPMTSLTDMLARVSHGPVMGLCHALHANVNFITDHYNVSREEVAIKFAGLNHFYWITEARAGGVDVIADLKRKLKRCTFDDLGADISKAGGEFHRGCRIATELFRFTGVMPYLGDRHTCEFFPHYITNRRNMKKYNVGRWNKHIKTRPQRVAVIQRNGKKLLTEKLPDIYFELSRESAASIIQSHILNLDFCDIGNLPNTGQISNLPEGTVVETAAIVNSNGFTPVNFGELPAPVLGLVEPWAKVLTMVVDACFNKDKDQAMVALRLDPLCSHLTTDQVEEIGHRLLKANRNYLTVF